MCYNNEWGTVCDDFWGTPDARVVCRQLGYDPTSAQSFSFSYFGQGSGSIWLDNVHCSGTETHLINCTANAIGSHNCGHYEDAGVRCTIPDAPVCTHGQARLARGPSEFEGQLEVCYDGQWGTVCDDFFSQVDARVACRNMFPTMPASAAIFIQYSYQYFGYSDLDILMDNVHCSGDEQYLVNCSHITSHNCAHFEDVGIACYPPGTYDGQVSLNPGPTAGRLMMYTSNSWGTVCRNSFGMEEATVVCRELGLPTVSPRIYLNLQFQRGYGDIKRRLLSCTGNETHLVNCTNSYTYCSHYSDVGVGCEEGCASGAIRLLDGANSTEGRVEVCRDGAWGTICDDDVSWGSEEARVVCKQLGLPYSAAQSKYFGPGPDPFHYSSFGCSGDEVSLETCDKDTTPSCYSHTQDVGVVCQEACTAGEVRLVNGQSNSQGRLEVCIGGLWGTVCDNQFHNVDAQVVCKQLGLPYAGAEAKHNAYFGQGSDHIALTSLYCTGSETQLFSCNFQTGSAVTCGHSNDVGVICQDVCANGALRVAGADLDNAGRLEVCYNAEWGTICDKGWDNLDVQVACYQLGFNKSFVRSFGGSKYGPGFGSIYFRDMGCQGTESKLQFCTSSTDTDDCDHTDDAGLQCNGARLLPTATPTSIPILPPPSPVTNVTFVIVNATHAYVSWDEPFQANGVITGYTVTINSMSSTQRGNDPRQYHFTNLNAGVPYTYSVTASNVFGNSSAYSQQFFTAELAPNTKVAMTGRRVDENTISMMWTPLNLMQARGEVTGYTIMWSEYGGASTNSWTQSFTADQSSYTIATNVMPSKQYIFDVYATNRIGNGPRLPYAEQIIVPTTSSAILQLKFALSSGQLCGTYTSTSSSTKLTDIINAVISQVKSGCNGCTFTRDYIFNERFKCNSQEDETDQVTFRAQFVSPGTTTNTTILRIIDSWLSSPDTVPTVSIAGVEYALDSNCQSSIASFDADYCTTRHTVVSPSSSSDVVTTNYPEPISTFAIVGIGSFIGVIVLIASMVAITTCIVYSCRHKTYRLAIRQRQREIENITQYPPPPEYSMNYEGYVTTFDTPFNGNSSSTFGKNHPPSYYEETNCNDDESIYEKLSVNDSIYEEMNNNDDAIYN
jgi:deleted-in-malignant-brain-tumors protein 1